MDDVVLYEPRGATAHITINRPDAKNAINLDVINQLLAALDRAAADPALRVLVLQGARGDFSAGGDIKDMLSRRGQAIITYERLRRGLGSTVRGLTQHAKPVLAAVDGVCLGAGAGIALACDALVATQRSTFGFPFVKVGLAPDTATSWLLPHMAGIQNARRPPFPGDSIPPEEAAGLGRVTRVVADGPTLEKEIETWSQKFANLPPTAVRDIKRLFWANLDMPIGTALVHEAMTQGLRFTTPEHAAAVDAFLAKKGGR